MADSPLVLPEGRFSDQKAPRTSIGDMQYTASDTAEQITVAHLGSFFLWLCSALSHML